MLKPPPLKDDCFALPPAVDWIPVDQVFQYLQNALTPRALHDERPVQQALRPLFGSRDYIRKRSSSPHRNSAIDGYAFDGRASSSPLTRDHPPENSLRGVPLLGMPLLALYRKAQPSGF